MKMKSILAFALSLCLLCGLLPVALPVSAAENLAVNGDLEMGSANGWETPAATLERSVVHNGKYALKLNATAAYVGAAFKAIPVRKNATVTVSFYYRYTENPSYSNRYRVFTYKGADASVGAYSNASVEFAALYDTYDTWQQASYTFNSGNYDHIYLKFCPDNFGSYPCYIDDLVVTAEGGDMPDVDPYLTSFGTKMNRPKDAASNLLKQGGFESANGAQWNTATFIKGNLQVVEDPTAPEGNKSLYLNGDSTARHTFPVAVEPGTQYVFSAWVKSPRLSDNNNATATFGVMDASGRFLVYEPYNGNGNGAASISTPNMQLMATAPDGEWHLRSVTFNSGSCDTIYVGVCGADSQLYLDDVALFKLSNGVEYISPLRTENITDSANTGNKYCADEDSLIRGIHMTSNDARLSWSDNPAWRNGFLSFADVGDSHGAVLKYTASAHTEWQLHYIDWIDVTPHTSYTLTLDVKRLATGGGRIALLDDKTMGPDEFYTIAFNAVDGDWVTHSITFDSGVFSRIGFAIVDGGGFALIDEVRLFETSKGVAVKPQESLPTLKPTDSGTSTMEMTDDEKLPVNGEFEDGFSGWDVYQQTTLSEDAAYSGKYGAHLKGQGTWGALLEQKNIPVVDGKTYTLSFRYKANSSGTNITLFGTTTSTQYAYVWACAEGWTYYTSTFTVQGDTSVWFNACGGGDGVPEDIYLDNIRLIPEGSTAKLGVAFLTELACSGVVRDRFNRVDLTNATVQPYGDGVDYPLLRMGALMTNQAAIGKDSGAMTLANANADILADVPVVYLWSVSDAGCAFAVRVVNVPITHSATLIYSRPYYVFEKDGEEIVVYGDIVSRSYDG